jgi:hypothetical protein
MNTVENKCAQLRAETERLKHDVKMQKRTRADHAFSDQNMGHKRIKQERLEQLRKYDQTRQTAKCPKCRNELEWSWLGT